MAVEQGNAVPREARPSGADSSPLARVMREFEELVKTFEAGLRRSLEHPDETTLLNPQSPRSDHVRREACRLAISDLSTKYTRKYIRQSLDAAECEGKRLEEQLHHLSLSSSLDHEEDLQGLHNGHFRLYSTELFDLLGQPTELRFGTLRFHKHSPSPTETSLPTHSPWITIELAINNSFFVADSLETLPYHTFRLPTTPSLQNRGILSRKLEDCGALPDFDSWLLFTFLGNGCIKLEVPIEMCADVYGGRLRGRESEEVLFWGFFVDDDVE
ncbi:hypothetical protein ACN47E_002476 [Coniothyrium glycines]